MAYLTVFRIMLVAVLSMAFPTSLWAQASTTSPTRAHTSAVVTGQPGLSFRFERAFGTYKQAYISDTNHINYPYGLGTDGNNVWISELSGNRALKYTSTGQFLAQIGQAGLADVYTRTIDRADDVGVDGSGNVWLADAGAGHVLKFSPSLQLISELGQNWNHGSADDLFEYPTSVAFDAVGNVYVSDGAREWTSDEGNHRIQVFNSDGTYLHTIGVTGVSDADNQHFHGPRHIAIYMDTLYVADSGNHRIQIFDVSNPLVPVCIATIGTGVAGSANNQFYDPSGVAVDANYIYVADTLNNRVQVFNRGTRAYVVSVGGSWGNGAGQLKNPSDVAVDASGNLYVADYENQRVQQFNTSRSLSRTYGVTGVPYVTDGAHFYRPNSVAVANDGSIYITEALGNRVVVLNPNGSLRWTVGEAGIYGQTYGDMNHFNGPTGVAVDAVGHVYVADQWNHRIVVYNSNGTPNGWFGGWGIGSLQFNCPSQVTIGPTGDIFVADNCNHRIQIFRNDWSYLRTLGVTGVSGADNNHFNGPGSVAVDSKGIIYVSDGGNARVQVFNANLTYARTMNLSDIGGNDSNNSDGPAQLAIDQNDNLYVANGWKARIQVFNPSGAYLTTIGGRGSGRDGQPHDTWNVAVDHAGSVYVAGFWDDHRIQKFAPGVPGWVQRNINGFGDNANDTIFALAPFNGQLYAGTANVGKGGELWRMNSTGAWSPVITGGFGISSNFGIESLHKFKSALYAGTYSPDAEAQVWRSNDGSTWNPVTPPTLSSANDELFTFAVFSDTLYFGTWADGVTQGAEVWRSSTGNSTDWTRVVTDGFSVNKDSVAVVSFGVHNGYLYAGTLNATTGGGVWRTDDGVSWVQVNTDGFGTAQNVAISGLVEFDGYLYATTRTVDWSGFGTEVWRCQACDTPADWEKVVDNGFGNSNATGRSGLIVFNSGLYLTLPDPMGGMQVWHTRNGTTWKSVAMVGFGTSANVSSYWSNSLAVFNGHLYVGTRSDVNGGQVWEYLDHTIFLPIVWR